MSDYNVAGPEKATKKEKKKMADYNVAGPNGATKKMPERRMGQMPDRGPDWVTVATTPLPDGWVNVYECEDGAVHAEPCPAVLTQERHDVDRKPFEPYPTRTVFANTDRRPAVDGPSHGAHGVDWLPSWSELYVGTFHPEH
ncbi:hypothetical protein MF406_10765 [Georgenia sp. TF02-10]|uniref:hypothetical protein n=1 Tax=Georgenia sp. TF02-10 TaxID=2917725 RepID=UPI001FA73A6E|nr:hypothetical protein [Georgenia sp. TF02-10]UNX53479.1 hypothetical protein MF406_10765 [Georgenia sp. TF02-10]